MTGMPNRRGGSALKSKVRAALLRVGYDVRRAADAPTMAAALARLAPRLHVQTVVDVGASNGSWTELTLRSFPNAAYLLIEAQGVAHGEALRELSARRHGVDYVIAAAGDREGSIHFDAADPFGGAASEEPFDRDIVVPMTSIDAEIERRSLQPPFLLKLDTHGFEVPILEGAKQALALTNLLVIEAYNFELRPGCLRFHEMCSYLEERGLRCIDLVDVLRRPGDGSLWQMDLFFVPRDRPEFETNDYRCRPNGSSLGPR
jgi:FkbM family methyltransferase